MSWWALDWRVGEDKKFGRHTSDGPVFYTSLRPWDRKRSDMRDFAGFLAYWGWRLCPPFSFGSALWLTQPVACGSDR